MPIDEEKNLARRGTLEISTDRATAGAERGEVRVTIKRRKEAVVITIPAPGVAIHPDDYWTLIAAAAGLKQRVDTLVEELGREQAGRDATHHPRPPTR